MIIDNHQVILSFGYLICRFTQTKKLSKTTKSDMSFKLKICPLKNRIFLRNHRFLHELIDLM